MIPSNVISCILQQLVVCILWPFRHSNCVDAENGFERNGGVRSAFNIDGRTLLEVVIPSTLSKESVARDDLRLGVRAVAPEGIF